MQGSKSTNLLQEVRGFLLRACFMKPKLELVRMMIFNTKMIVNNTTFLEFSVSHDSDGRTVLNDFLINPPPPNTIVMLSQ